MCSKPSANARSRFCLDCRLERQREAVRRYQATPRGAARKLADAPKTRERARDGRLVKLYGLTLAEVEALRVAQGGCCAICRRPDEYRTGGLNVDHCHVSGKVRQLLCATCNVQLGVYESLKQDGRLERFEAYLTEHAP